MAPKRASAGVPKASGKAAAKAAAKAIPKAAGGPLQGTAGGGERSLNGATVVFTGELDGMTRDEIMHKVKAAGAKVMSGVSGNTAFLILGSHLDDGRPVEETSKYRKYLELKAKGGKCPEVLREPDLLQLLGATNDISAGKAAQAAAPKLEVVQRTYSSAVEQVEPWVERHAPSKLDELLGNASAVKKLTSWLRDWDDVVLRGRKKPVAFKPGGGAPDNVNARAALVSGPPGIGKTTASRLVARTLGWEQILEYNASDARGQKVINALAEGLADNRTLCFGGSSSSSSSSASALGAAKEPGLVKRAVIIMDEVDGMGAGDRGGNAALIRMIKKTKNPIICICNDHSSPKVRSLAFSCYDVRFSRPTKTTIAQRVAEIAASEGLAAEPNALEALSESCGNDVRHCLNQLQVLSKLPEYKSAGVGYEDMCGRIRDSAKDEAIMMNPFEACRRLLTSSVVQKMSVRDRYDHFFIDHNLMHLMVQENYLGSIMKKPCDFELLDRCAQSAASIAEGDVINERIRGGQEWSLLPDMGLASTIYPTSLINGFVAFPDFPKFLGNYSKMSRARRLCAELHAHLRLSSDVKSRSLTTSGFIETLFGRLLRPLQDEDVAGAVAILDAYGLQREHVAEHLSELMQHLGGEDEFKLVDPKVKAAMTRELNSGSHVMKVVLPQAKKRKAASVPEGDDLGEEGEGDAQPKAAEAETEGTVDAAKGGEEEDVLGGLVRKAKAKRGAAGKAKAKAKSGSRASADIEEEDEELPKASGRPKASAAGGGAGGGSSSAKAASAEPAGQSRRGPGSAAAAQAKATGKAKAKGKAEPKADAKAKAKAKATGGEPAAKRARR